MSANTSKLSDPYFKKLLIFSAFFAVIFVGIHFLVPEKYMSNMWPAIFAFVLIFTALMHLFISRNTENDGQKYIRRYMISILIKLTVYLIAIAVYIILNKADAIGFIIAFFIVYMGFTFFENQYIFKQSKKK